MEPSDLLDYALGRLDGPRLREFEAMIARDPELAERVARVRRNLGQILDDGEGRCTAAGDEPPRLGDPDDPRAD